MVQRELFRWGGRRRGAGRPPKGRKAEMSHMARPSLARSYPVHVTVRVKRHVYNLRSDRCFDVISAAFENVNGRFGFQIIHYSVQGNHIHLIIEAENKRALARGMQALQIRIAKGLNRVMKKTGSVFEDRYHAHILETPTEVRNALAYLRGNHRKHAARWGEKVAVEVVDERASDAPLWQPRTWLLQHAAALRQPVKSSASKC